MLTLAVHPGLCAGCRHREIVRSARSAYLRCRRSDGDPRYPRYPALPVLACAGWERERDAAEGRPGVLPGPG